MLVQLLRDVNCQRLDLLEHLLPFPATEPGDPMTAALQGVTGRPAAQAAPPLVIDSMARQFALQPQFARTDGVVPIRALRWRRSS
jgi:hypothetical protein